MGASKPEQAATITDMNRLSFKLKSWAESLAFMSAVMHGPYLKRFQPCIICTVYEQPAVDGRSDAALWQYPNIGPSPTEATY